MIPIHTSTLNLLARLICPDGSKIIAYDPHGCLADDESAHFIVESSSRGLLYSLTAADATAVCLFNLSGERWDVSQIDWLIEFNQHHQYPGMDKMTWNYINNPDGSPRWFYPANLRKPRFLAFYNFTYWKATLYKFMVKSAFFLRISAVVSNGCTVIHSKRALYLHDLIQRLPGHAPDYAVFGGTAGPNRKAVVAEGQGRRVGSFLKIALSGLSAQNIDNEFKSLRLLEGLAIKDAVFPIVSQPDEHVIRVSNIKPVTSRQDRDFGAWHWRFLGALFDVSVERKNYCELAIASETRLRLTRVASHPRLGKVAGSRELFDQLVVLHDHLQLANPVISTSISHGDFTPWNVYSKGDTVFAYDWEFCRPAMPALFDFFHYVIQGKVFSENASLPELQAQCDDLLQEPGRAAFLRQQGLDGGFYRQLYLLFNASYYLELYLGQALLHKEAYRLLSVWSQLLAAGPPAVPEPASGWSADRALPAEPALRAEPMRKTFIRSFFSFLEDKRYVVLKSAGKSIRNLSRESDLDILLAKADLPSAVEWLRTYPGVEKFLYTRKSFMTTMQLFFADQSFLSIDLLQGFHRKSLEYIPAAEMLDRAEMVDGIRMLPPAYDYLYIYLFYHLNYTGVPSKYSTSFDMGDRNKDNDILGVLNRYAGIGANELTQTFAWSAQTRSGLIDFLRRTPANRRALRLGRWLHYTIDTLSGLFRRKGVMLTFSGVDGAGKSTVLGDVRDLLQQKYRRKVVVLRHRPGLLPILSAWKYGKEAAEEKCISNLPRKGSNKSRLSSLLRFGYYYSDYLLGQLFIYIKYTLRGYVVLYDRYYFDFIVDGKRSNILLRQSFVRQLYRFVYKPQLNVFLFAAPDVILKRKQELTAGDIAQLTKEYQVLFSRMDAPQQYLCIENTDKQSTIDQIEHAYVSLN